MKIVAPCKDCPDRTEDCHGTCEKYKEWASQRAEAKKAWREKSLRHAEQLDYIRRTYSKMSARGASIRQRARNRGERRDSR